MKKSIKILIILSLLILLLSLGSVNANSNSTDDNQLQDSNKILKKTSTERNITQKSSQKTANIKNIYVSVNGDDYKGKGSQKQPYKTLNQAVRNASKGDSIILLQGDYTLTNYRPIEINKSVNIKGQNKNNVIIKSYGSPQDLITVNKGSVVQISNLQFKQCNNRKTVINNNGNLILNNIIFQKNILRSDKANTKALINNQGTISIKNTLFEENIGYKGSVLYNTGYVQIRESTIKKNKAVFGGALYNNNGSIIIKSSSIISNAVNGSTNYNWDNENYVFTGGLGGCIYNNAYIEVQDSNITHNYVIDGPYRVQRGGAIYNTGTLVIKKSNLNNNHLDGKGGAIYSTSKLIISNSNIKNNKASYAGAIQALRLINIKNTNITNNNAEKYGGAIVNNGQMELTNSLIKSNNAVLHGGGLYNTNNIVMNKCNLTYNEGGAQAGAIFSNGKITVTSSNINFNRAGMGGAIYTEGTLNIISSTLTNNKAQKMDTTYGGAIQVDKGSTKITNSKINQNTADYGGAIGIWAGKLVLINTQLNNNQAVISGGAVSVFAHDESNYYPKIEITKCTMNNNNAKEVQVMDNGEFVWGGSLVTIKDSVFSNNGKKTKNSGEKKIMTGNGGLKIYNSKFTNNDGKLISDTGELTIDSCTITDNKCSDNLIDITCYSKITNTKIRNNVAKNILRPMMGQGPGNLVITKSVLYNPKAKLEINNENYEKSSNNVNCNNNWWGTKTKPTNRVFNCIISRFNKGLK